MARLSAGWPALPYPPLEEMLAAWKEAVSPVPVSVIREKDTLHFQASLPKSHLRGSQAVYCLAVSGATPELPTRIREFVRRCSAPGRLIFVFCFSEAAEAAAKSIVKSERCVIWGVRAISDAWPS